MLENKESFRLLYQAISELSVRIGDNQLETNSVSLLLLDFDFEHEVFDKLMLAIMKYLGNVSLDDINHRELLELIDQTIPEDRQLNEFVKNKIIIGFANNYFPELQTVANHIKNEMGMSIAKSKCIF
ncbi:hypothetical protein MUA77_11770 [Mammaliicoccus sciuri]|nr:hypothetical protein [Mammaliicoccus sciuri]UXU83477.1 hypothetical protein MUA77_11770 [Mammaliicoccus sciuri]UXU93324.1 hypothetical protein MUA42_11780 [Mammaliicoccus sciuri]UXV15273.1 hypothetical protein MUA89_12045 [Mammaliicoccus sciuri]UXV23537.1 hypothetical protein MUA49_11775 [Mammaliicoccus sciuri]UXV26316.1 hypothetical protein MUA96_12030 [Mammaliicoccus sciuri]